MSSWCAYLVKTRVQPLVIRILEARLIFRSDVRAQLIVPACDDVCQSLDNELSQHGPPPERALTANGLGLMATELLL